MASARASSRTPRTGARPVRPLSEDDVALLAWNLLEDVAPRRARPVIAPAATAPKHDKALDMTYVWEQLSSLPSNAARR